MIVKGFNVNPDVPSWPDFWTRVENGQWEPEIFALMDRFLKPGWAWVDIGAWIGPTALYAASKGAVVEAYEPDPVALERLRANLRLNPSYNVTLFDFALGVGSGVVPLWCSEAGNSESSIIRTGGQEWAFTVTVRDALDTFLINGYHCFHNLVVKIDVEGAEFLILPRIESLIAKSKCAWVVSFHDVGINPARVLNAFKDLDACNMDLTPLQYFNARRTIVFLPKGWKI